MQRCRRQSNGLYYAKGVAYKTLIGCRSSVGQGFSYKTPGGLTKKDLLQNDRGRWVSRKKFISASREQRLKKHGYGSRKGKFGYVRL